MFARYKRNSKRLLLIVFLLAWSSGFVLTALSPIYRGLYAIANNQPIDFPYALFETTARTHPRYYADLRTAFRDLSAQIPADKPVDLFVSSDALNTANRRQQLDEYAFIWAYPHKLMNIETLADLPPDAELIISGSTPDDMNCINGADSLFLCH